MRPWQRLAVAAALSLLLTAAVGCGAVVLVQLDNVPTGAWAGDHALLVVGNTVSTVQFDCAHATLDSPIRVDRAGRFDVTGNYVREHGGPTQVGAGEDRHAARFSGSTDGVRLTLSITVGDLGLHLGPFLLVLGGASHIVRCV